MFSPETACFPEKLQQVYETDIDVLMKTHLNKKAYISKLIWNLQQINNRRNLNCSTSIHIYHFIHAKFVKTLKNR